MSLSDLRGYTKKQQYTIVFWALWMGMALVSLIFPWTIWIDRVWAVSGLGVEVFARRWGGLPLSPIIQKIDDFGSDHAKWYQGYRALAYGLAALMSYKAAYVVSFVGSAWAWPFWIGGLILGLALFWWNTPHWTRPEKYDR